MNPQDPTKQPKPAQRAVAVPARDAAANVVRGQLDALYNKNNETPETAPGTQTRIQTQSHPQTKAAPTQDSASNAPASQTSQRRSTNDLQQYHTAWQEYYQKYYEQYYTGHVHKILSENSHYQANSVDTKDTPQTVDSLRGKIQDRVQKNAKKARKSRHFVPVSAAILVMLGFAFLQYNSELIGTVKAYVSPGTIDPQNIVVDPTTSVQVGPESKLIIPKINVDVPVVYNVGNDHSSQMAAMENGVAHFAIPGANSVPGQIGNTAIAGHSSNDLFEAGNYKFVFVQLEKLETGDMIYANYGGVRYSYTITKKEIVTPSEVSKLTYATDKPIITLITCWPTGTADKRLLVTGEQVSPDPAKAAAASSSDTGNSAMPGNSATTLERLFGAQ